MKRRSLLLIKTLRSTLEIWLGPFSKIHLQVEFQSRDFRKMDEIANHPNQIHISAQCLFSVFCIVPFYAARLLGEVFTIEEPMDKFHPSQWRSKWNFKSSSPADPLSIAPNPLKHSNVYLPISKAWEAFFESKYFRILLFGYQRFVVVKCLVLLYRSHLAVGVTLPTVLFFCSKAK